jgi:hypothetical protein
LANDALSVHERAVAGCKVFNDALGAAAEQSCVVSTGLSLSQYDVALCTAPDEGALAFQACNPTELTAAQAEQQVTEFR